MKSEFIEVEHSGYSEARGIFCDLYYIDPNKMDYKIYFPDGDTYIQNSEFHARIEDWNHDGDRYEQFGAFFKIESLGRSEFVTPEMMISFITDYHCKIPGIEINGISEKCISLEQKLKAADTKQSGKNALKDSVEIDYEHYKMCSKEEQMK